MNAALGFDSYLVVRHDARVRADEDAPRLGCYYYYDVVAPVDVSMQILCVRYTVIDLIASFPLSSYV